MPGWKVTANHSCCILVLTYCVRGCILGERGAISAVRVGQISGTDEFGLLVEGTIRIRLYILLFKLALKPWSGGASVSAYAKTVFSEAFISRIIGERPRNKKHQGAPATTVNPLSKPIPDKTKHIYPDCPGRLKHLTPELDPSLMSNIMSTRVRKLFFFCHQVTATFSEGRIKTVLLR